LNDDDFMSFVSVPEATYKEPEFMDVEVTQDDIDNGVPEDPCNCPIALALNRAFPGTEFGVNTVSEFTGPRAAISSAEAARATTEEAGAKGFTYFTPSESKPGFFVKAFDRGEKVEPIKVSVRVDLDEIVKITGPVENLTNHLRNKGERSYVGYSNPSR